MLGRRKQGLIDRLSFDADAVRSGELFEDASWCLRASGVVVLKGYYSDGEVAPLRARAIALLEELEGWEHRDPRGFRDGRIFLSNRKRARKGGYGAYIRAKEPTINLRRGTDEGLVDIFHPEKLWPDASGLIADQVKEDLVSRLMQRAYGRTVRTLVRNIYVQEGVTRTRGFHVDGYSFKAKTFVYLTDVRAMEDGPYCYAPGTHWNPLLHSMNRVLAPRLGQRSDDAPSLGLSRPVPLLGSAGDLIISLQFGAHRGIPQAPGHRRAVLVQALFAKGDLPRRQMIWRRLHPPPATVLGRALAAEFSRPR